MKLSGFKFRKLMMVVVLPLYLSLMGCDVLYSKETRTETAIGKPAFSPTGEEIAFLGYKGLFRLPSLIGALPDGGRRLPVYQNVYLFSLNINTGEIKEISCYKKLDKTVIYFGFPYPVGEVICWAQDDIYSSIRVSDVPGKDMVYIRTNTKSGITEIITEKEIEKLGDVCRRDMSSHKGDGEFLVFDGRTISIMQTNYPSSFSEEMVGSPSSWQELLIRVKASADIKEILDREHLSQLDGLTAEGINTAANRNVLLGILNSVVANKTFYEDRIALIDKEWFFEKEGIFIKNGKIVLPGKLSARQNRLLNMYVISSMVKYIHTNSGGKPTLKRVLLEKASFCEKRLALERFK